MPRLRPILSFTNIHLQWKEQRVSSRTLKRYGKSIDKIYIKGYVFYKDRSSFDRMEVGVFRPSYLTFDHSSAPAFLLVPLEVYSIIDNVFLCSAILQTCLWRIQKIIAEKPSVKDIRNYPYGRMSLQPARVWWQPIEKENISIGHVCFWHSQWRGLAIVPRHFFIRSPIIKK